MDPSETEPTADYLGQGAAHSGEQARWPGTHPVRRIVRAFLGIEATSFFLAAMVHAGFRIQGYEHREAMIAESVIGTVLLVGLTMTWIRSRTMFSIAAGVQAFALLGAFIGTWTIVVGIGLRAVLDIVYHAVIVLVLMTGLVVAWRLRGTRATG
ncbi:hypothetical protein [Natrinema gelatinilyticum]|uniref:hypothetical protein n=1 Tax=Natrinema gelatinilyticum TaxID=2961571 RepID=UPI0020C262DD|nr:hypothetical protein [Natrinema gelatinilyticum]